jgi:hypothetical protein
LPVRGEDPADVTEPNVPGFVSRTDFAGLQIDRHGGAATPIARQ